MKRQMRSRTVRSWILIGLALAVSGPVFAATLSVPGGYSKIQDAIDAASPGDTVTVTPGTYVENIDFKGKAITVQSTDPSGPGIVKSTIIDGNAAGSVVAFKSAEGAGSVLDGFTIRNGLAANGGGICIGTSTTGASPVIRRCVITGNTATTAGGGIYCQLSSPVITNTVIAGNYALDFVNGRGGGIAWDQSSPTLTNDTITANKSKGVGGGIGAGSTGGTTPIAKNCILWANSAFPATEISLGFVAAGSLTVRYCDVPTGPSQIQVGAGSTLDMDSTNINNDPLFINPGAWTGDVWTLGDYHEKSQAGRFDPDAGGGAGAWTRDTATSPCIDKGDPNDAFANETAPNGGRINQGVYGNTPTASRTIKPILIIAGTVLNASNAPLAGVLVTAGSGGGISTTGADGSYAVQVPFGWTGTLSASLSGWGFNPASSTFPAIIDDQAGPTFVGSPVATLVRISGYVQTSTGTAIAGATVSATNGGGSVQSGTDGVYTLSVPPNWTGMVLASKSGWTFDPASRSYSNLTADQANQNYTGTASTPPAQQHTISGYARTAGGAAIQGVTVLATNGGGATSTDANGYYVLSLGANWTGVVTVSLAGWAFTPENLSFSSLAGNQSDQNFVGATTGSMVRISGFVKLTNGTAIPQAAVTATNGGGSATTDVSGYYGLAVPTGWSGTVTAAMAGVTFDPANRPFTNLSADQSNQNFNGTAVITSVDITGPTQVVGGNSAQYACKVTLGDGSVHDVSSLVAWSVDGASVQIDSQGLLTTSSTSSDQSVTVTATYAGLTKNLAVTVTGSRSDGAGGDGGGSGGGGGGGGDSGGSSGGGGGGGGGSVGTTGGLGGCGSAGMFLTAMVLCGFLAVTRCREQ